MANITEQFQLWFQENLNILKEHGLFHEFFLHPDTILQLFM